MPERRGVRFQTRSVSLLAEDVAAFEHVLLRAFPDLRFLPRKYPRVMEKALEETGSTSEVPPQNLAVPYRSGLHNATETLMMAWREPEDWSPDWRRNPETGRFIVRNEPERHFFFDRTMGPFLRDGREEMDAGRIWGSYHPEDKEQKAFVAKVVRLVAKVATNKLAGFVPGSRTDLMEIKSCGLWAGPQAIEWCRKDPRRRLGGCRPLEEVETGLPPLPDA